MNIQQTVDVDLVEPRPTNEFQHVSHMEIVQLIAGAANATEPTVTGPPTICFAIIVLPSVSATAHNILRRQRLVAIRNEGYIEHETLLMRYYHIAVSHSLTCLLDRWSR
jgi:hypothetical protein